MVETLRRFLERFPNSDDSHCECTLFTARSGLPTATLDGRYVHSRFDPEKEAERLVSSLDLDSVDVLLLFGLGLGYHIRAIRRSKPRLPIIVVEPTSVLLSEAIRFLEDSDTENPSSDDHVVFYTARESDKLIHHLKAEGVVQPRLTALPAYSTAFPTVLRDLSHLIESYTRRTEVNRNTLKRFGRLWVRNIFQNSRFIAETRSLSDLEGRCTGFSALVCGAGPTLEEDRRRLLRTAQKGVVIAVETAVPRLEQMGVPIDIVVAVDPQYWNTRHVDRISDRRRILVTEPAVNPRILRLWEGPVFMAESVFPLGRILTGDMRSDARLGAGGSVATTAWDLARYCGAEPVRLAGVDLGFPDFQTHCRDSFFENRIRSGSTRFKSAETGMFFYLYGADAVPIPAAGGDQILSDRRMEIYRDWFREQISLPNSPETEFLSRRSAAIPGVTVYRNNEEQKPFERFRTVERLIDHGEQARSSFGSLQALPLALRELLELGNSLVTLCDRLLDMPYLQREDLSKLEETEEQLRSHGRREIVGFLISDTVETILSRRAETLRDSVNQSRGIGAAIRDSATYHLFLMDRYGVFS